jgi:hypothetical protein
MHEKECMLPVLYADMLPVYCLKGYYWLQANKMIVFSRRHPQCDLRSELLNCTVIAFDSQSGWYEKTKTNDSSLRTLLSKSLGENLPLFVGTGTGKSEAGRATTCATGGSSLQSSHSIDWMRTSLETTL